MTSPRSAAGEDDHDHGAEVYPEGGSGAGACGGSGQVHGSSTVGFMVEGAAGHAEAGGTS